MIDWNVPVRAFVVRTSSRAMITSRSASRTARVGSVAVGLARTGMGGEEKLCAVAQGTIVRLARDGE